MSYNAISSNGLTGVGGKRGEAVDAAHSLRAAASRRVRDRSGWCRSGRLCCILAALSHTGAPSPRRSSAAGAVNTVNMLSFYSFHTHPPSVSEEQWKLLAFISQDALLGATEILDSRIVQCVTARKSGRFFYLMSSANGSK
eukprot:scaffold157450_cov45-Tisochrysis_lutea.AAC.1